MKRPSFQFYPADWRNNAKLRRCSWAARGVWIELMGLMHDSDEYGLLRWPLKQIAQALGCPVKLLNELVECGVLYGCAAGECVPFVYTPRSGRKDGDPVVLVPVQVGPIWYSPRMVRDEYVRSVAGASTRFSAEPKAPSPAKTPRVPRGTQTDRARLRDSVLAKTEGLCHHCGTSLGADWQIDHYIPRSKGGRHTFDNMVPSCTPCNQDKSDTLPDDWAGLGDCSRHSPSQRQGDGSTSSSTSSSSTSVPSGTSVDARQRFEMFEDWQPDEMNLAAQLRMQGVARSAVSEAAVAEFVAYWSTKAFADSQGGWCHQLVKRAKALAVAAAAKPAPAEPAAPADAGPRKVRL